MRRRLPVSAVKQLIESLLLFALKINTGSYDLKRVREQSKSDVCGK